MRLAAACLLAGALAALLASQLACTKELSNKSQKSTSAATGDNKEKAQDQSKNVWEEQQERRLLVKRAVKAARGFRADPMMPDTRRGGLGSSARSIGDPSVRSAFFSKRRRLQSRARSASAKARSMARPSARTSARSAARRLKQRSVVAGATRRRRLRSGARSMSGRRARKFRNSRRLTGWQPIELGRFTRSAFEKDDESRIGASFDQPPGSVAATARAGLAPFMTAPTIVQQQSGQTSCSCPSQVASSDQRASQEQQQDALAIKSNGEQLGAQLKDGHHQKSEQISVGFGPFELFKIRKTIEEMHHDRIGQLLAQTILTELEREHKKAALHLRQVKQLKQLLKLTTKQKQTLAPSSKRMREQQEPKASHETPRAQQADSFPVGQTLAQLGDQLKEGPEIAGQTRGEASDGEEESESRHGPRSSAGGAAGASGAGLGTSSVEDEGNARSGPAAGAEADSNVEVDLKGQKETPRSATSDALKDLAQVVEGADKLVDGLVQGSAGQLPVVGGTLNQATKDTNLTKTVDTLQSGLKTELGGARSGSPADEATAKVDVGAEGLADKAESAVSVGTSDEQPPKGPPIEADVKLETPRSQEVEGALKQADKLLSKTPVEVTLEKTAKTVEGTLEKTAKTVEGTLDKVSQSESPRAKAESEGDKDQSQATASSNESLKITPTASVSQEKAILSATGPEEAKLSGSFSRPDGEDTEAKLDEEIKSTKPNLEAPKGTKRGPDFLEAIGDSIKKKLETPEVKQEVRPAIDVNGHVEVLPELQQERDMRDGQAVTSAPPTKGPGGEQPEKQVESEQQGAHKSSVSIASPESEKPHVESSANLKADVWQAEQAPKAVGIKVEETSELASKQSWQHTAEEQHEKPTEPHDPPKTIATPAPVHSSPPPAATHTQPQEPPKSSKGPSYKPPRKEQPGKLYESQRIDRLPAKCASKLFDLTGVLNETLKLIEELGQRALADTSIDYLSRDSLSRKLAMVRAFAQEARMQANLSQLRRLNDSARAAGVELMRLANWSVAHKLDKKLRPLALQVRKLYISYRKGCKGVASS